MSEFDNYAMTKVKVEGVILSSILRLCKHFLQFGQSKLEFARKTFRGCCGRNRMVVGFITTCAISAYHH
jgi:hypothetical protein